MRTALLLALGLTGCSSTAANPDLGPDLTIVDLAPVPCVATFTGAVTGSVTNCTATASYDATMDQTTLSISGAPLAAAMPAGASWSGLTITLNGTPSPGTFTSGAFVIASTVVSAGADWRASKSNNQNFGTLTLTISSVSAPTPLGGGNASYQLDGSAVGTLVTVTAGPAVQLSLSF